MLTPMDKQSQTLKPMTDIRCDKHRPAFQSAYSTSKECPPDMSDHNLPDLMCNDNQTCPGMRAVLAVTSLLMAATNTHSSIHFTLRMLSSTYCSATSSAASWVCYWTSSTGTCWQCDSLSADDRSHRGLIWQGPIGANKHGMCLGLCDKKANCHLTPPPRGTPVNIRICLIFPKTRIIGLHFCRW